MGRIRDGDWSLFDYDFGTGRSTWIMHNPDGSHTFRIDQPVDEVVRANAEQRNASEGERFGEWAKVASVPLQLYHSSGLVDATREQDDRFLSRWLNDADNRDFRTFRGKV